MVRPNKGGEWGQDKDRKTEKGQQSGEQKRRQKPCRVWAVEFIFSLNFCWCPPRVLQIKPHPHMVFPQHQSLWGHTEGPISNLVHPLVLSTLENPRVPHTVAVLVDLPAESRLSEKPFLCECYGCLNHQGTLSRGLTRHPTKTAPSPFLSSLYLSH